MTVPEARRSPWPASAFASDDAEWVQYLHRAYYLLGLLWVAGHGEQAIAALCSVPPEPSRRQP